MSFRAEIQRMLERKEEDIRELQVQIDHARVYVQALKDTLRRLPETDDGQDSSQPTLRPGSGLEKAQAVLRAAGKPLHISDLTNRMGGEFTGTKVNGLVSSLTTYAKKGKIFTKT